MSYGDLIFNPGDVVVALPGHRQWHLTTGKCYTVLSSEFSRGMAWVYIVCDDDRPGWYYAHHFKLVASPSDGCELWQEHTKQGPIQRKDGR